MLEKLTPQIGSSIWKTAFAQGQGMSFFKIFLWWPALDYRAFLDLPKYWSHSLIKYNLKGDCWCVDGDMGSSLGLGVSSE